MKCIVGLGNPGRKYERTRHNIGFMVIEELLSRNKWKLNNSKFNGKYSLEYYNDERIILLKPQTFMNLSGETVRRIIDYYQIKIEKTLVIYDDLDLPTGKIRLREKGGHGGHNGVRSVIDQLNTKNFKRLRIGIGRPVGPMPVVDYVLSPFSKNEREETKVSIKLAADACEFWLKSSSFSDAMNEFNK